ncbi:MAG: phosphohistidine phosphatase SixA [Deltaproteobacteria bacterium]|nr:phosphohistidine phosphatase SixA [Deltaproteobacteria bacterium]MBT4086995.1 phosphohistidine phosphatase SixA [Deltaproteobacteria bacterium]MBT4269109.1 phosphohistidine phosphatase SixA [Deltaproteobacteria bacterium]MBT4641284.1 phosphohistidine phosphatase SixA [Deltaproteobacteria bacterium]MBT6504254.1 phosphohistidine phosphatase SixA [Deltaproteobacteria bacterium]
MSIFLVQHALALPREMDPAKGISEEGQTDTERIASVAKGYHVRVNKIQHSGKKRARQTAEIFEQVLKPEAGIEASLGLNPLDDVADFGKSLNPSVNDMIVSHLPFLEKLTSWLIIGKTDQSVFKFQNGGIVCLDKAPEDKHWHIKWTLMPKIG